MAIKPDAIDNLPAISDWQYQMALIASRLPLGLLTGNEIDWLMDNGHYHNLMLEIINDDPIYPTTNYSKVFEQIWKNLNFPMLNDDSAKLINTVERLYPFSIRPYNVGLLYNENITNNYDNFYENNNDLINAGIYDSNYIYIDSFQAMLYDIESCIRSYEVGYIKKPSLYSVINEFFELCEHWINSNKSLIISIINQFPKNPL